MKKERKKQYTPVVIVCVLILLLLVIGLAGHFISKYIPTSERMDLTEYYGQPGDDEEIIVLGTDIMEERAVVSPGYCNYLSESEVLLGQFGSADSLRHTF